MRVEDITRQIHETVYIARDGKQFNSSITCQIYEDQLDEEEAEKAAMSLPHFFLNTPNWNCDGHCAWYYVANDDELAIVKRHEVVFPDGSGGCFFVRHYPCWVQVKSDESTERVIMKELDEEIADHVKYLETLGRIVQECTPKEEED